jgi:hypothetical protein
MWTLCVQENFRVHVPGVLEPLELDYTKLSNCNHVQQIFIDAFFKFSKEAMSLCFCFSFLCLPFSLWSVQCKNSLSKRFVAHVRPFWLLRQSNHRVSSSSLYSNIVKILAHWVAPPNSRRVLLCWSWSTCNMSNVLLCYWNNHISQCRTHIVILTSISVGSNDTQQTRHMRS